MKRVIFNCVGAGPEKGGMFQYTKAFIEDYIEASVGDEDYTILSDDEVFREFKGCHCILIPKDDAIESRWKRLLRVLCNLGILPFKVHSPKYIEENLSDLNKKHFDVSISLNQRTDNFKFFSSFRVSVIHDAPKAWSKPVRKLHSISYYLQFDSECNFLAKHSDLVLVDSDVSADILRAKYKIDAPIRALYFRPLASGKADTKENPTLPSKFFLYPSTTHPVKNHKRLIDALSLANQFLSEHFSLVLCGPVEVHTEAVLLHARLKNVHVQHVGYVSEEIKAAIMNRADALIMPSVFNFTNIPLFEAVFANCPVLCSEMATSREIFGEALRYFHPLSVESIASAIVYFDLEASNDSVQLLDELIAQIELKRSVQLKNILDLINRLG